MKRYFESQPAFLKGKNGEVRQQRVTDILTHPIYAGYITHKNWKINWVKAQHEPLISLETYEEIQERRKGALKVPSRKNINHDFPLRGFVLCGDMHLIVGKSGKPLTKESFSNLFKAACKKAGIPNKSAHGLRKIGATRAAESGATVAQLEALSDGQEEQWRPCILGQQIEKNSPYKHPKS